MLKRQAKLPLNQPRGTVVACQNLKTDIIAKYFTVLQRFIV